MRLLLLAALLFGCGNSKRVDKDVDRYINVDFAPTHAKILAARKAYGDTRATDIDEPGRLAVLKFNLGEIAAPFLAQALAETKKLSPPPGAQAFHDYTVSVLSDEAQIVAELAASLSPVDPARFKAAHEKMMEVAERVMRWQDLRERMVAAANVKLAPLPTVKIPEAMTPDAGT